MRGRLNRARDWLEAAELGGTALQGVPPTRRKARVGRVRWNPPSGGSTYPLPRPVETATRGRLNWVWDGLEGAEVGSFYNLLTGIPVHSKKFGPKS